MTVEYDEIRITTRREITICQQAIKKLVLIIEAMEEKYSLTSCQFLSDFKVDENPTNEDLIKWHDSCLALKRWQERLSAHWQIMEM